MQKERKSLIYTRNLPNFCLRIAANSSISLFCSWFIWTIHHEGHGKKITRGKGYGAIFNCLATRTIYIDLADGYDTDSFILVLRRFISIRLYPVKIRLDPGSQLVPAGKEIKLIMQD